MATGAPTALAGFDVSRETFAKLEEFTAELVRWQAVKNLVARASLADLWSRHVADSLQLLELAPAARTWLDLGSGAGFPGLVIAIAGAERGLHVDLVESNERKSSFLRHVARRVGAPATIHAKRLEEVLPGFVGRADVVSARALAPFGRLLGWTEPLLRTGSIALFPKGRSVDSELTEAAKSWRFTAEILPSRTDSRARILRVTSAVRNAA